LGWWVAINGGGGGGWDSKAKGGTAGRSFGEKIRSGDKSGGKRTERGVGGTRKREQRIVVGKAGVGQNKPAGKKKFSKEGGGSMIDYRRKGLLP